MVWMENILLADDESLNEINNNLRLIEKKDGLTFGSDAYLLAAYVRTSRKSRAADLGSGTGVIPLLLLSRNKIADCAALEVQPEFAELISRNAAIVGFMFIACLYMTYAVLPLTASYSGII